MSKITVKKKTENFTILDNTLFKDESISWKAKGLLAYLLHLPNDWQIYLEDLKNRSTDGIDSTRSAMNELIEKGYIERQELRELGKFKGYEYTVLEKPISVKPKTEKPISDNPTLISTKENKLLNVKSTNKTNTVEIENFFEECWSLYPNKLGKASIKDKKKKEIFAIGEQFKICIKRYVENKESWRKYQNGSTFFNSGYVDYLDSNFKEQSKDYVKQQSDRESEEKYGF